MQLEKVAATSPQPVILEVRDSVSGTANERLTPNGVVEIYGTNIKISGDDATVGLYFVDAKGTEIKAATVVQNKPSTVIALIPGLSAGTYTVKVVTQFNGSGQGLKAPRNCVYNKPLTVA